MARRKKDEEVDRGRDKMLNFRTFAALAADFEAAIDRLNLDGVQDSGGNALTFSRVMEMAVCWILEGVRDGDHLARMKAMRHAHQAWLEADDERRRARGPASVPPGVVDMEPTGPVTFEDPHRPHKTVKDPRGAKRRA